MQRALQQEAASPSVEIKKRPRILAYVERPDVQPPSPSPQTSEAGTLLQRKLHRALKLQQEESTTDGVEVTLVGGASVVVGNGTTLVDGTTLVEVRCVSSREAKDLLNEPEPQPGDYDPEDGRHRTGDDDPGDDDPGVSVPKIRKTAAPINAPTGGDDGADHDKKPKAGDRLGLTVGDEVRVAGMTLVSGKDAVVKTLGQIWNICHEWKCGPSFITVGEKARKHLSEWRNFENEKPRPRSQSARSASAKSQGRGKSDPKCEAKSVMRGRGEQEEAGANRTSRSRSASERRGGEKKGKRVQLGGEQWWKWELEVVKIGSELLDRRALDPLERDLLRGIYRKVLKLYRKGEDPEDPNSIYVLSKSDLISGVDAMWRKGKRLG